MSLPLILQGRVHCLKTWGNSSQLTLVYCPVAQTKTSLPMETCNFKKVVMSQDGHCGLGALTDLDALILVTTSTHVPMVPTSAFELCRPQQSAVMPGLYSLVFYLKYQSRDRFSSWCVSLHSSPPITGVLGTPCVSRGWLKFLVKPRPSAWACALHLGSRILRLFTVRQT